MASHSQNPSTLGTRNEKCVASLLDAFGCVVGTMASAQLTCWKMLNNNRITDICF